MTIIKSLRAVQALPMLFANRTGGYLHRTGWLRSRYVGSSVDFQGEPIPWMTYASLDFLRPRVRAEMSVFEFGSGSSTIWWSRRVNRLVSCEHDRDWYDKTRIAVAQNVELIHLTRDEQQYSKQILKYQDEFDIVVNDGRDRVRCIRNSLLALKSSGVIVWDNSDRTYYQPGYEFLSEHGFRRIDFTGMGPINVYGWTTSVFYRDGNCLGI